MYFSWSSLTLLLLYMTIPFTLLCRWPFWSSPDLPDVFVCCFCWLLVESLPKPASSTRSATMPFGRRLCYPDKSCATQTVVMVHGWRLCYNHQMPMSLRVHICQPTTNPISLILHHHFVLFHSVSVYLSLYPYFSPYCKSLSTWYLNLQSCWLSHSDFAFV